jgi:hypothetical protein
MEYIIHQLDKRNSSKKGVEIKSDAILINNEQDALDLMANADYQYQAYYLIIHKKNICAPFFDLKTGLAGAILQKFANYQVKLAIIGDFTAYKSKSFHDFRYECNKNGHILFVPDIAVALQQIG